MFFYFSLLLAAAGTQHCIDPIPHTIKNLSARAQRSISPQITLVKALYIYKEGSIFETERKNWMMMNIEKKIFFEKNVRYIQEKTETSSSVYKVYWCRKCGIYGIFI